MYCEVCGVDAPTKHVSFHQNIGVLVMRFYRGCSGNLCKSCIHKTFWTYTAINLTLGWWGIISLIVTPFFVINNTVYYLMCLGMEPPAPGATQPQLTDEFIQRIGPHTDYLVQRLNQGATLQAASEDVASRAGVTPGQVALFVRAMAAQAQQQQAGGS
jgi:hypothetical protein